MGALYALVLTITMTNGDYQDVIWIFTKASSSAKQQQLTNELTANASLLRGLSKLMKFRLVSTRNSKEKMWKVKRNAPTTCVESLSSREKKLRMC